VPAFYQVFTGSGLPPEEKISVAVLLKSQKIFELRMVIKIITHCPRINGASKQLVLGYIGYFFSVNIDYPAVV